MKIVFSTRAWDDYLHWQQQPQTLARLNELIRECTRTPFQGTGKPEPLKDVLDEAGRAAEERGLTPEILDSILNGD